MRMSPVGWRTWVGLAGGLLALSLLAVPDGAVAQDDTDADAADDPDADTEAGNQGQPDPDDGEPDEPPPIIRLRPPDEYVPSALDDPATLRAGEVPDELRSLTRLPRRSTAFVRPRLTGTLHGGDKVRIGVGLGATLGQRWWSLEPHAVSWSGENRLVLEGVVGSLGGWRAQAAASMGPWIGRLGVRLGPTVEVSRLRAGEEQLDPTLLVGGELTVAADLDRVYPWIGLGTAWDVLGERERGTGALAIGTETEFIGGLAVQWGWVQPRVEVQARVTEIGPLTTALIGVQLRPPLADRDDRRHGAGSHDDEEAR